MLRLLFRKLPQVSTLLRLPLVSPLAADQSSPIQKPDASSRGFSSTSDSHLSTLISYGVTEEQASTILAKFPLLRKYDPKNILKPKLDFLLNAGFTGADLAEVLTANPFLLGRNLERTIAPAVHFLMTIRPSKDFIVRVLKFTTWPLVPKEANIKLLKAVGVPGSMIEKLLLHQPSALARREEDFTASVDIAKELGLDPTTSSFVRAVGFLWYMSRSSFQRKVDLYRELGWSKDAVYAMFKSYPHCIALSDENIRVKMGYFMEKLGWSFEFVAANPALLRFSLERRIVRRCAVLNLLMEKGLLSKKNTGYASRFKISDRVFVEKFVSKYEEEAPEVVKAYEGKIAFQEWECLKYEEKNSSSRKP